MAISQRTRLEGDSGMSAREPHQGILGPTAMSARFHKIRQGERRPFRRTDSYFLVVVCWYHAMRFGTEGLSGWRSSVSVH